MLEMRVFFFFEQVNFVYYYNSNIMDTTGPKIDFISYPRDSWLKKSYFAK